mmetsp:Transcript_38506/g.94724  ORF Transcript_38506/g.94724 Transcript_38506/m.94724 type:complete len:347 (-) Transcript_38506:114-1154(-)
MSRLPAILIGVAAALPASLAFSPSQLSAGLLARKAACFEHPRQGLRGGGGGAVTMAAKGSILDSHLHVWSDGKAPFPWAAGNEPPKDLQGAATVESLLGDMDKSGVAGALIVQPINHKFDHSYVEECMKKYPSRLKGMCLANPNQTPEAACSELRRLKEAGFVGVRFNPGLWPEGKAMDDEVGKALYTTAGELGMVVGFMCFTGLDKRVGSIISLLEASPETQAVIDHFGFFRQDGEAKEEVWAKLLALSQYPQVHVKTSAFFRVSGDPYPYQDLWLRVRALVQAFGSDRLLYGSDFPFVQQQCGYKRAAEALSVVRWGNEDALLNEKEYSDVMRGTFTKLFGSFQ